MNIYMKTCTKCGDTKQLSAFSFRKQRNNYNSHCKQCHSLRNLAGTYGVSPDDYQRMLVKQKFCCALCGTHEDSVGQRRNIHRKLCVDHDHNTGKVRALLCHNCNVLLGHANDDIDTLQRAITYLFNHKE